MEQFDITLVFFNSRLHNHFLSIIKHFGKKYRICVWVAPYHKASRTPKTNTLFLELCKDLGATVIENKEKISTKLLFATHIAGLNKEYLQRELINYIDCQKKLSFQGWGVCGGPSGKALLETGFKKHIVFDKELFMLRLDPEERGWVEKLKLIEMGNIIRDYPVFEDFNCDYLVCLPTKLSFEKEDASFRFLRNLITLFKQINSNDSIVIKLHTAKDNESPFRTGRLFGWFAKENILFVLAGKLLTALNTLSKDTVIKNRWLREALMGTMYRQFVKKRCTPFSQIHKYWNLGAQLFLPKVKKGLLTGRSSVVWYALTQKIPVFNCDEESCFNKAKYLNIHQKYYGVPFSDKSLEFDKTLWQKVTATKFELDNFIDSEISSCQILNHKKITS